VVGAPPHWQPIPLRSIGCQCGGPLPRADFYRRIFTPPPPRPICARARRSAESNMHSDQLIFLSAAILVVAFLYSSVGHAGASGYIAVMSLFGLSQQTIKPTALTLNIIVASIATWQFYRAGHFSWRLFWPFALLAIPFAFMGGYLNLPTKAFKILVGCVLLFSAVRFLLPKPKETEAHLPSLGAAIPVGAGLGFLSGLTGTGGGIFLTPLLLFMNWASTKPAAGVSALFILVNSISGLAGNYASTAYLPSFIGVLVLSAVVGGGIGSYYGSSRFDHLLIKRMLAVVLLIAGTKLILT